MNLGNFLSLEPHQTLGVDLLLMVYLTDTRAGRVRHRNTDRSSFKCRTCFKSLIVWVFNCLSSFAGGEKSVSLL